MKLLNGEIFGAVNALNELYEKEWPVRTSLALAKLTGKLNGPFIDISKVKDGLVQKYGEVDKENSNSIAIKPESENFGKFAEEYNELMMQEADEVVFEIVKLPQEVDGKPLMIKANLLLPLEKFIEIETLKEVK